MHRRLAPWFALALIVCATPVAATESIPPAESFAAVPDDVFNEAVVEATRNGVASLLARQQAPENDTSLVFPPMQWRRVVEWTVTEVPHRAVKRKEAVYENTYGERLAPQRDEYGEIIGYKKERIVISRRIVGHREVTRYVRDPEGDVMRDVRRPVYESAEQTDVLPRGYFGLNGMALYVLCEAGLGNDPRVREHAQALHGQLNEYGLPDTTWDIAWLAKGYAVLPDRAEYEQLIEHLASKLIGGQTPARSREGGGLWGPVAINYDAFLRYLDLEMKVRAELNAVREAADALPEDAKRQRERATEIISKLEKAQGDLFEAMRVTSQQGSRLRSVTRPWKANDTTTVAPLPYYVFSRVALDIGSTARAASALATLQSHELLLPRTVHPTPTGKPVVSPVNTRSALAAALAAIVAKQDRTTHGWNEANLLIPNATFAKVPPGLFEPVPDDRSIPTLLTYDTVPSNLAGYAALHHAGRAAPTLAGRFTEALERAEPRALAALDRLIDAEPKDFSTGSPHRGKVTTVEQIKGTKGRIVVDDADPALDTEALFLTRTNMPAAALASATALFEPNADTPDELRNAAHFRRLAFRLMMTQGPDGQWNDRSTRRVGTSSVEHALDLQLVAERRFSDLAAGKTNLKEIRHDRPVDRYAHQRVYRASHNLYPTLAALVVLVEGVDEPIDVPDALVLPDDELLSRAEAGTDEAGQEETGEGETDAAEPLVLDAEFMAGAFERPNAALTPLQAAVGHAPPTAAPDPTPTEQQESDADAKPTRESEPSSPAETKGQPTEGSDEPSAPVIEDNLDAILGQ